MLIKHFQISVLEGAFVTIEFPGSLIVACINMFSQLRLSGERSVTVGALDDNFSFMLLHYMRLQCSSRLQHFPTNCTSKWWRSFVRYRYTVGWFTSLNGIIWLSNVFGGAEVFRWIPRIVEHLANWWWSSKGSNGRKITSCTSYISLKTGCGWGEPGHIRVVGDDISVSLRTRISTPRMLKYITKTSIAKPPSVKIFFPLIHKRLWNRFFQGMFVISRMCPKVWNVAFIQCSANCNYLVEQSKLSVDYLTLLPLSFLFWTDSI